MKDLVTKEEIKQLFDRKIKPRIASLEAERKIVLRNLIILVAVMTSLFVWGSIKFSDYFHELAGATVFITAAAYYLLTRSFVMRFKQEVVKEVFNVLITKCQYQPLGAVARNIFEESKILNQSFDEFKGEDHVRGLIGNMKVEFSEIKAIRISRDSKGRKSSSVVYGGLFFAFQLDKDLDQNTLILTDVAEKNFGRNIGRFFQKNSGRKGYDLVQLESVEFEKEFVVYSDDQIKSRVLLKPVVLQNLSSFKRKYKEKIDISIRANMLYLGIQTSKNHFEPQILGDVVKFKDIREIYDLVMLVRDLQEDLEIDTAA